MNYAEERLLLNSELGKAIAQWGFVEGQLLRLVEYCTRLNGEAVPAAYLSIENFRSKLAFCSNLVSAAVPSGQVQSYWNKVKQRTADLAPKRNQLAHGWHVLYVHGSSGKRFGIVPTLQANGKVVHRNGIKPPPGTLFLRDVVTCRMAFHALTAQVCNVYELLCGRPMPFPEADGPAERAPSVRTLENRLRAELGRKPRPSKNTISESPASPDLVTPPTAGTASDA